MESGVVPVHERGGGLKAFRLPPRERPPRLDGSRLVALRVGQGVGKGAGQGGCMASS